MIHLFKEKSTMINRLKIKSFCVFLFLFIFNQGFSQADTNRLALTHFNIHFEDSTEQLISLVFSNKTSSLVFSNPADCKHIGISSGDTCNLVIRTNKSTAMIFNVNEFLAFPGQQHRLNITCPKNHSDCFFGEYLVPDYSVRFHSHTLTYLDLSNGKSCIEISADTNGYPAQEFLHLLD
jgi:hypothetical protein